MGCRGLRWVGRGADHCWRQKDLWQDLPQSLRKQQLLWGPGALRVPTFRQRLREQSDVRNLCSLGNKVPCLLSVPLVSNLLR